MAFLTKEKHIVAFDVNTPSVVEVDPGTTIEAEVLDWCFGEVDERPETYARASQMPRCPAAGPIAVKGANPGDALAVTVLEIAPKSPGFMVLRPDCGPMGDRVQEIEIVRIPLEDESCLLPGGLHVPQHPMLGVIGTTPAGDPIPTLAAGDHGGNLDTREICVGSEVHLPVFIPGGMLAFGDTHAAMGDGELSGSGIECGATVRVRIDLLKNTGIQRPRILTPEKRITLATHHAVSEAVRLATEDMADWLHESDGLDMREATLLIGASARLGFSHVINTPGPTVKLSLERIINKAKR